MVPIAPVIFGRSSNLELNGVNVAYIIVVSPPRRKRRMSASARARIAKAQRARWAKVRAAKKNA